jgi:ribosomal 50S subunit-recycling heat shock protein
VLGVFAVLAFVTVAYAAEGGKRPGGMPTFGELMKIDGKALTIKTSAGEKILTLDDATEITNENPAKLEDLKVGDSVRITQGEKSLRGEITKIDGKTVTLKGRGGEETATVEAGATITVRVKAKFEDLKVGQNLMVSEKDGKVSRVSITTALPKMGEGKGKREKK